MELSNLNIGELRDLAERVEKQLERAARREKDEAIEQIFQIAHRVGMPLNALFAKTGGMNLRKATKPATPYRHPEDAGLEWSGRGPRPKWIKEALAAGKSLDDFRQTA